MADSTQHELGSQHDWLRDAAPSEGPEGPALAIAWSLAEPERVGQVARIPSDGAVLGRGDDQANLLFVEDRPDGRRGGGPLGGRLLSRRQCEVRREGDGLHLVNTGSRPMRVDGQVVSEARVGQGAVIEWDRQLVVVVVSRSGWPEVTVDHPFGQPDAHGVVGESPAAWALRARLTFLARRGEPVLVRGDSGSGKEQTARALHHLSGAGPFVARNASTLPEGLVDAELFGTARGYPQAGMPPREGLIGSADGGTLFLDEIGEMPEGTQAHLLRVLDAEGEYQRLGESGMRRSRFRCVAATNRARDALKHDLSARFIHEVVVPGLGERREDIPLLVAHLLREAEADDSLRERFFDGGHARIAPALMVALLRHPWTHHVRELSTVLWAAVSSSPGRALVLTPEVDALLQAPGTSSATAPSSLDADTLRQALARADGNVTAAAEALGLSSRYALYRLMRRHGVER